jgi:hypothetical protein
MWRAAQLVRSRWRQCWDVALAAGAALSALALPPRVAFVPRPALALALVALGGAALFWPGRGRTGSVAHSLGAALLWGVIAWCALSQVAPLTRPPAFFWSLRALPVALLAGVWLLIWLPRRWQRSAVAALALPTVSGLGLVAWASPPQPPNFMPYYVAVDSHGVVYASDQQAPVIRVFGPDGALRAKIRPGLASLHGTPSAGLYPPGPYNDPDQLGVPRAATGTGAVSGRLQPWAPGTDDFWFCGLAVGDGDRLYVVDWMRGRLLRFAPDGRLELRVPLPASYHPSLGCVTAGGGRLYLGDESGAILTLDAAGHVMGRIALPEAIIGGVSLAPDGCTLYALARARIYAVTTASGRITSWPLPAPSGALGQPYQAILALGDRVLIANLQARRVDTYTPAGAALAAIGSPGAMPGQFGQVGGLARDPAGEIYVADVDHRALQRFGAAGAVNALLWSPDDDEID